MQRIKGLFLVLALVLTAMAVSAGSAFANTAANTQIVNFARLTYSGGSAQATVTVTVALKPSAPNVTISYGNSAYTGPNNPAIIDTVTITSTANGPASYTVTPSIPAGGTSNVQAANPASVNAPAPTVTIGASVTTGTSGLTYVTVPAGLASGNNSAVNGIGLGSTIIFTVNGTTYNRVVSTTTDNGNGTFAINWTTAIGDVPPAGTQIAEQKQVNVNVLPGTVQNTGTDLTVMVTADVTTPGATTVTVTTAQANKWTTPSPNVSITKYVRNFSDESIIGTKGATSLTINTVTKTFYTEGVTAKPGQTLEYVVVATNTGVTDLTGSALSDQIPIAYVNLVTGPGPYGGKEVFYIDPNNGTATFTAAGVGANQASFVAASTPNLVVNVGNGANSTTTGTIPAGKSVTIAYQVTVK